MLITARMQQEKIKYRGYVPFFLHNNILYASKWIAQENDSISNIFLRNFEFINEDLEKKIRKAFKEPDYNLSSEELDTYKLYQILYPIYSNQEIVGYELNEQRIKQGSIDDKLIKGKVWDNQGKCLNKEGSDQLQRFRENFTKWIDYPHLLDKELQESFDRLGD